MFNVNSISAIAWHEQEEFEDTNGLSESVNRRRGEQTTQWPKEKVQKRQTMIYKTYT